MKLAGNYQELESEGQSHRLNNTDLNYFYVLFSKILLRNTRSPVKEPVKYLLK